MWGTHPRATRSRYTDGPARACRELLPVRAHSLREDAYRVLLARYSDYRWPTIVLAPTISSISGLRRDHNSYPQRYAGLGQESVAGFSTSIVCGCPRDRGVERSSVLQYGVQELARDGRQGAPLWRDSKAERGRRSGRVARTFRTGETREWRRGNRVHHSKFGAN